MIIKFKDIVYSEIEPMFQVVGGFPKFKAFLYRNLLREYGHPKDWRFYCGTCSEITVTNDFKCIKCLRQKEMGEIYSDIMKSLQLNKES